MRALFLYFEAATNIEPSKPSVTRIWLGIRRDTVQVAV